MKQLNTKIVSNVKAEEVGKKLRTGSEIALEMMLKIGIAILGIAWGLIKGILAPTPKGPEVSETSTGSYTEDPDQN